MAMNILALVSGFPFSPLLLSIPAAPPRLRPIVLSLFPSHRRLLLDFGSVVISASRFHCVLTRVYVEDHVLYGLSLALSFSFSVIVSVPLVSFFLLVVLPILYF